MMLITAASIMLVTVRGASDASPPGENSQIEIRFKEWYRQAPLNPTVDAAALQSYLCQKAEYVLKNFQKSLESNLTDHELSIIQETIAELCHDETIPNKNRAIPKQHGKPQFSGIKNMEDTIISVETVLYWCFPEYALRKEKDYQESVSTALINARKEIASKVKDLEHYDQLRNTENKGGFAKYRLFMQQLKGANFQEDQWYDDSGSSEMEKQSRSTRIKNQLDACEAKAVKCIATQLKIIEDNDKHSELHIHQPERGIRAASITKIIVRFQAEFLAEDLVSQAQAYQLMTKLFGPLKPNREKKFQSTIEAPLCKGTNLWNKEKKNAHDKLLSEMIKKVVLLWFPRGLPAFQRPMSMK